jgi:biopolymer transport protein ExbB/TolQ
MQQSSSLFEMFMSGGLFMWPLLFVSLLVTVIGLERFMAYRFRYAIDGKKLFLQVKKYLLAKDSQRALETCRQYSLSPVAQVLAAGLTHSNQSIDEVETAMEAEALHHVPLITDRLGYLSILANIATLLGLLGTIAGLITSFASVGAEAGAQKGTLLASGISVAMYTTAFGLIIAIPTLLLHHYLSTKANRLIDDIQHFSTELKKFLQRERSEGSMDSEKKSLASLGV